MQDIRGSATPEGKVCYLATYGTYLLVYIVVMEPLGGNLPCVWKVLS